MPAPPEQAPAHADEWLAERTARVNTIRVAVVGSTAGGRYIVERLVKGQPLPAGTKEATLVLSDDAD